MTRRDIKEVLDRVLTWPEDRQEDVARVLIEIEEYEGGRISPRGRPAMNF
jgi:hypothetical protein